MKATNQESAGYPVGFYPPGTTLENQHSLIELHADNAERVKFLDNRGWTRTDVLRAERRKIEDQARLAAERDAAEAQRKATELEEKNRKESLARQEREAAELAKRQAEEKRKAEIEDRVNFVIQVSKAASFPLELRNKTINELLTHLPQRIRAAGSDEERSVLGTQFGELQREREQVIARLAEIGEQTAKDMEEAQHA